MKLQPIILYCLLQSIYSSNVSSGSISTRIVGGKDARDGEAPFQCWLLINQTDYCGCSIIARKYILTAGHCVLNQVAEKLDVLVGTNDLTKGGKYYKVANYSVHEDYDVPKFANDIAVVKLRKKIHWTKKVRPIALEMEEIPDGALAQLTGWGRLQANGSIPTWLQIINLKIISTEKCSMIYGKDLHDSVLCTMTQNNTQGACLGDSGGPLVYKHKIIGVVKSVIPCGTGFPDFHTKVSHLHDWIVQQMI